MTLIVYIDNDEIQEQNYKDINDGKKEKQYISVKKLRKKKIAKKFAKKEIMNILHANDVQSTDDGVSFDLIKQQLPDINIKIILTAISELKQQLLIYSTNNEKQYKLL